MQKIYVKTCRVISLLLWITLLTACGGVPRHIQIAQRESMTLEEKLQQLVYRGASRTEVVVTLGPVTGYTHDTLSYTVHVTDTDVIHIYRFPIDSMQYLDPDHSLSRYRLVLTFDENGSLYDYHRLPIDYLEEERVYHYFKYKTHRTEKYWDEAYKTGFAAVQCRDTRHCWAVGAGLILETTDGGKSWVNHVGGLDLDKHRPSADPLLYSVDFPDPLNGWLSGGNSWHSPGGGGLILHSADGGENWEVQLKTNWWQILPTARLSSITFRGNRQGLAVGSRGTIFHTSDSGNTWTDQSSGTKEILSSVAFCDAQSGWAVGSRWTILHTSDGGQSWRPQTIQTDQLPKTMPDKSFPWLTDVNALNCHQGWIAGGYGTILHTEDGGLTWLFQPSGTTERLNAVQFISPHQGWAVGDRGVILKTINGGQDWITQSSGTREDLRDLSFVDENHGWVGGSYGLILHTADGGITWKKQCLVYDCAGEAAQQFYWQPWLK
jgi:photosystem II stability/assembly factor-like uncharacterized protein